MSHPLIENICHVLNEQGITKPLVHRLNDMPETYQCPLLVIEFNSGLILKGDANKQWEWQEFEVSLKSVIDVPPDCLYYNASDKDRAAMTESEIQPELNELISIVLGMVGKNNPFAYAYSGPQRKRTNFRFPPAFNSIPYRSFVDMHGDGANRHWTVGITFRIHASYKACCN